MRTKRDLNAANSCAILNINVWIMYEIIISVLFNSVDYPVGRKIKDVFTELEKIEARKEKEELRLCGNL